MAGDRGNVSSQKLNNSKFHMDISKRKLPPPSVYWSDNEKDAYRRNRVVLTRFHMVMDDISIQESTMRKTFRYETHKFRQKNSKYFQTSSRPTGADTPIAIITVPPPTPMTPKIQRDDESDVCRRETNSGSESESESGIITPRRQGIITRAKKPSVKFSVFDDVIETNNKYSIRKDNNVSACSSRGNSAKLDDFRFRSLSALPYNEIPELPNTHITRYQSALPILRTNTTRSENSSPRDLQIISVDDNSTNDESDNKLVIFRPRLSDIFFDKSKAAYQLRQELRRRARLRKQGITTKVLTIRDALSLEKEKYQKSHEKVTQYIKRLDKENADALKLRWTKEETG
ncbi:hypothetical protein CHS0354_039569 [Potamilus streckersoni]|uniref:Uncharacterized protein n=1 Tax=Potamilus streckersoni TaxID=2493646 RepID=A0AAE0SVJ1_9BIVA|nr:hypothetical protein CHS0354_039569 [Potamilus streckersoni]